MKERIIDGISTFDFVISLNGIIYFLKFLMGDRMIRKNIRTFEVDIRQWTLMIAKSATTEGYLLNFVLDYHMQNTFRAGFYVISKNEVIFEIPHFEVIGSCSE